MGLFRLILKSALTDDRGCVDYNVLSRNLLVTLKPFRQQWDQFIGDLCHCAKKQKC